MSSNPPRKFDPTPVEQTTKSSRQPDQQGDSKPKARRFAPEPVETSTKSSRDRQQVPEDKPKPRRFVPEPVEQSTKSSKDAKQQPSVEAGVSKQSRFAPQVIEESRKSSKDKPEQDKKAHVKFQPEPISISHRSNRKPKQESEDKAENGEPEKQADRKFAPILLDTAKRSRRAGDASQGVAPLDRTEYGFDVHAREHRRHITGERTPVPSSEAGSEDGVSEGDRAPPSTLEHSSELRRQVSPLDGSAGRRAACLLPARTHSFRAPDLDTIESSESEPDSNPSPISNSPGQGGSPITASDSSYEFYKHATRIRESVDENFTHYLLDLERKKAQQRLEEQALAAYPNADFGYEPPRHYGNEDDSSSEGDVDEVEDRPVTWEGHEDDFMDVTRRESTEMSMEWEQAEAQRYAEEAQQERNANKVTAKQPSQSPWWKPADVAAQSFTGEQPDAELKSMRDRARPPMLGTDLVFPRCPSPEPARFDVTQGSTALRQQMSNLTAAENEKAQSGEEGGLWHSPQTEHRRDSTVKTPVSPATSSPGKGLWGGFCSSEDSPAPSQGQGDGLAAPQPGPTGLMTPKAEEKPNPLDLAFTAEGGRPGTLMTPPIMAPRSKAFQHSDSELRHLDAVLTTSKETDKMIEQEYPDSFITQVYNYLSLGYPSLARPFDEELSKISRIPISSLRQDDVKARSTPRGYIRLGQDFEGGGGEGMTEEGCMRWQALKLYVREWARQERDMAWNGDGVGGNWGTGARRGSWAI